MEERNILRVRVMVLEYDETWITQISSFCEWVCYSLRKYIKKSTSSKNTFEGKDREDSLDILKKCSYILSIFFEVRNIVILVGKIEFLYVKKECLALNSLFPDIAVIRNSK